MEYEFYTYTFEDPFF